MYSSCYFQSEVEYADEHPYFMQLSTAQLTEAELPNQTYNYNLLTNLAYSSSGFHFKLLMPFIVGVCIPN